MPDEQVLRRQIEIHRPVGEVFEFYADAGNLELITPPELRFSILTQPPIRMREGALIDYRLRLWGLPVDWRTLISRWDPPHGFVDEQIRGPYALWIHTHTFVERSGVTVVRDEVRYRLPLSILGRALHPVIRRQLDRIFDYREHVTLSVLDPARCPVGSTDHAFISGHSRSPTRALLRIDAGEKNEALGMVQKSQARGLPRTCSGA